VIRSDEVVGLPATESRVETENTAGVSPIIVATASKETPREITQEGLEALSGVSHIEELVCLSIDGGSVLRRVSYGGQTRCELVLLKRSVENVFSGRATLEYVGIICVTHIVSIVLTSDAVLDTMMGSSRKLPSITGLVISLDLLVSARLVSFGFSLPFPS
jgi:hypothetical protein